MAIDVDAMIETAEESAQQEAKQEQKPQAEEPAKQEEAVETKSESGKSARDMLIPVSVAKKLRSDRRDLRAENEELRKELNQLKTSESSEKDSELEDDDLITVAQAKAMLAKSNQSFDELRQEMATSKQVANLDTCIANAKTAHEDFDEVTSLASKYEELSFMTEADLNAIQKADDPAIALYDACLKKRNAIMALSGTSVTEIKTETKDAPDISKMSQKEILELEEDEYLGMFNP